LSSHATQPSQLLPTLFADIDEEQRLTLLHIGPAFQETLEFLSQYRCRIHVVDVFSELPPPAMQETEAGLAAHFTQMLQLPAETTFDICLFWDLFNYLDPEALTGFMEALRPSLAPHSRGHGFSVHNPRHEQKGFQYSLKSSNTLTLRPREHAVPGYRPHNQQQLKKRLSCYHLDRSVLLADSRLELSLRANLA